MNILKKTLLGFCAISMTVGLSASAKTLKLGYNHTDDHPTGIAMIKFAELVNKYTDGRYDIKLHGAGQLGDERKMLEQVQIGSLDLAKTATNLLTTYNDGYSALVLPFMFKDVDHFVRVTEGEIGQELLDGLADKKMRGLVFLYDEPRSFYTTKKSIVEPADLKGQKIRTMNSADSIEAVEFMGGIPTPMSWGDVYTSLQQGVVDGAVGGPSALTLYQHGNFAKFFSNTQQVIYPGALIMSEKTWSRLSDDDKAAFKKAALEASQQQREQFLALQEQAMEDMVKMGVEITSPDIEAFRERVNPIYEEAGKNPIISNYIEKIQSER